MNESELFARWVLDRRRTAWRIQREVRLGRLRVKFSWRSREFAFGRFGGGWNWKVGVQAGGRTLIVSLLIFSVRIDWCRDD